MKNYLLICSTLCLFSCTHSHKFSESDLPSSLYQGYWAMYPINDNYRVIKFQTNGNVKIYDYRCESAYHYQLNSTENVYLSTIKPNVFTLLDNHKKPFAQYQITQLKNKTLNAKQTFLDKKIEPRSLDLQYINIVGEKPICTS